jgi:predicted RNA methylase
MLACRAGAARVYAIESDGIAGLARQIVRANGLDDRIVGVRGHSMHVRLPEPADVVVCDQIGQFGFEAGVIQYFADARRRLLKPGARLIPSRVDLWLAPVEHAGSPGGSASGRRPARV